MATRLTGLLKASTSLSGYQVHCDSITIHDWDREIVYFQDATINQTWSFGASLSGASNLSHIVVRRDNAIAAMAQVRIVRIPVLNRGMAYLAWGPLWHRSGHERDYDALWEILQALRSEYAGRRKLYLEIKPNIWNIDPEADDICRLFIEAGFRRLPSVDHTFIRSIRPDLAEIRKQLAQKWRNQLNYAQKHGLATITGTADDLLDRFSHVYREMVNRKNYVKPVDIAQFILMSKQLPPILKPLVVLASLDEQVLAGAIFSVIGNTGIYLLGATGTKGLDNKASYIVQWRAIEWMKEHGINAYDLGGTDCIKTPGTYHFKAGVCGNRPCEQTRLGTFVAHSGQVSRSLVSLGRFVCRLKII